MEYCGNSTALNSMRNSSAEIMNNRNNMDGNEFQSMMNDNSMDSINSNSGCGGCPANPINNNADIENFLASTIDSSNSSTLPSGQSGVQSTNALSNIPRDASVFSNGPARYDQINLTLDSDGTLSEGSKKEVAELLSSLSEAIGDKEVFGAVFENAQGGLSMELTPGTSNSVSFNVPNNLIYSAHTHPGNSTQPSSTDIGNRLEGEEAIINNGNSYTYA